ncbi:MAG: EAL domain-containing protein [Planctomycetes bacterium]|nr:EAL domain-containing protein [Planctomycetota bacterium]
MQSDSVAQQDQLTALRTKNAALQKTIDALVQRVEQSEGLHGSAHRLFEETATLQGTLDERTEQLCTQAENLVEAREELELQAGELCAANRRLEAMRLVIDEHIILGVTDSSGKIIEANRAFSKISQYSQSELLGQNHRILNSGLHDKSFWKKMWKTVGSGNTWHAEVCNRAKDGSLYWVDTTIVPLRDPDGGLDGYLALRVDITARKLAEEGLKRAALFDDLTKLPNRALLGDRLQRCMDKTKRDKDFLYSVLFIDLDNFKYVNDSLGHEAGDELLIETASRLSEAIRLTDSVGRCTDDSTGSFAARFGGDEFVMLLEGLHTPEDAIRVAERVGSTMARPHRIGSHDIAVQCSIGILHGNDQYLQVDDLLRDADTAMYEAKSEGKARYVVFDESMHTRARERLELENDLRCAVESGQIQAVFQPIVHLESGRIVSFEALARWNHPTRGAISPAEFVPIAEETGLIMSIGNGILVEACSLLEKLSRSPDGETVSMNVNLSRRQLFDPAFLPSLDVLLQSLSVPAERLRLEITESAVMDRPHMMKDALASLKALGVQLHMDDFGTGMSSLSLLRTLPLDGIKIDRSFIVAADNDRESIAILNTIISLGRNLNMSVTAEGIEKTEQLATVLALECDLVQGYLFGKPAPKEDAEAILGRTFDGIGQFATPAAKHA